MGLESIKMPEAISNPNSLTVSMAFIAAPFVAFVV